MLIEFCCPVCRSPLAVDEKVAGGQVNCPKCQKLILIPLRSLLERQGDQEPLAAGLFHASDKVLHAIVSSVEPYRLELDAKTKLLNDAVEMVKVRNQRIREVETLMLGIQRELWELEVDYDERNEAWKRAQTERRELRKKLKDQGDETQPGLPSPAEESAAKDQRERESKLLEEYRKRVEELEEKSRRTQQQADVLAVVGEDLRVQLQKAKGQLGPLEDSLSLRNEQLSEATGHLGVLGALSEFTGQLNQDYARQEKLVAKRNEVLDQARALLQQASEQLEAGEVRLRSLAAKGIELARERDSWKQQAEDQRQANEERDRHLAELRQRLEEQSDRIVLAQGSQEEKQARITDLEQALNQSQKDLLEREQRLDETRKEQRELLEKRLAAENQKAETLALLQAETLRADALNRKVEGLQVSLDEAAKACETLRTDAEKERGEARARWEASVRAETETRERATALEKEIETLRKALAAQPDPLETHQAVKAAANEQIDVLLQATQEELTELRGQHRNLEDRYKALQNRQAHDKMLTERLMKLELENRELQKTRLEMESELEEAKRLNEKLSLQAQAAAVQTGPAGNGGEGASVTDLLRDLQEKQARIETFDQQRYELDRQVKELNNENKRLQNTVKTLSANLKAQWKRGSTSSR